MDDLVDKYKNMRLSHRLTIIFILAVSYPVLTYSEESQILGDQLEGAISVEMSAKAKVTGAEKTIKKLVSLEQEIDVINKELTTARKYLPEVIEFDEILAVFGSFEKELGVQMIKFVPGEAKRASDKASYKEVPLNMELQAEFSRVMIFLDKIVHRRDLVHIRQIEFTPVPIEKDAKKGEIVEIPKDVVRAKIGLVFYRKDS